MQARYAQRRACGCIVGANWRLPIYFWFSTPDSHLSPELSVSTLYNRAVANNYAVNNRTLLSIAFHYDLLKALRRSVVF
jgi:hypothetical protein